MTSSVSVLLYCRATFHWFTLFFFIFAMLRYLLILIPNCFGNVEEPGFSCNDFTFVRKQNFTNHNSRALRRCIVEFEICKTLISLNVFIKILCGIGL